MNIKSDTRKVKVDESRPFPRVSKGFSKPSKTRQSEMVNTDLKKLVERFRISGQSAPPQRFLDVSTLPKSRLEAFEAMQAGREAFESLPLKVRQAVDHDPRRLEDWILGNPQLAAEHGLLENLQTPPSPENPSSSGDPGEGNAGGEA